MYYGEPDSALTIKIWRGYGAQIGENVHLNPTCQLDRGYANLLEIQDNVVVAMGSAFILHDSSVNNIANGPFKLGRIVVQDGAYIGAFVVILPGVVVGKGAIIGAGSLVTSDVMPGTVVAGRPARPVGNAQEIVDRFTERSFLSNNMVMYMPFLSQKDRAGMAADELKAFFLNSERQIAEWARNARRDNSS